MTIFVPLIGPDDAKGRSPKGVAVAGWQRPDYKGVDEGEWTGVRLDDYVVVDCDDEAAKDAWLAHIDLPFDHTWVRKTPHGYHFFYRRCMANLHVRPQKLTSVSPKIDLKAGIGHQVVFHAPGYETINLAANMDFVASWVPAQQEMRVEDIWDEMPDGLADNAMISWAGAFRRWGMSQTRINQVLAEINRITMTREPMPEKSLRRIARQAAKYSPEERRNVMCPNCGHEVETV